METSLLKGYCPIKAFPSALPAVRHCRGVRAPRHQAPAPESGTDCERIGIWAQLWTIDAQFHQTGSPASAAGETPLKAQRRRLRSENTASRYCFSEPPSSQSICPGEWVNFANHDYRMTLQIRTLFWHNLTKKDDAKRNFAVVIQTICSSGVHAG